MKNKRDKNQGFSHYNFFLKNRKGISGIIVAIIMIGLVLVVTAIVWSAINNLISENISSSQACFGNFGKITLDRKYTCYSDNEVRFSINIADIKVDDLLVSIASNSETKSFRLTNVETIIDGGDLKYYSRESTSVKLPGENSGITYIYTWSDDENPPNTIKIAPTLSGKQCDISDTIGGIDDCGLLA